MNKHVYTYEYNDEVVVKENSLPRFLAALEMWNSEIEDHEVVVKIQDLIYEYYLGSSFNVDVIWLTSVISHDYTEKEEANAGSGKDFIEKLELGTQEWYSIIDKYVMSR